MLFAFHLQEPTHTVRSSGTSGSAVGPLFEARRIKPAGPEFILKEHTSNNINLNKFGSTQKSGVLCIFPRINPFCLVKSC